MSKITTKLGQYFTSAKRVFLNGERFLLSVAMLITVGTSYYAIVKIQFSEVLHYAILVSCVLIGIRALAELIKFLDRD